MAFPKAKRFNDPDDGNPPVGAYDIKIQDAAVCTPQIGKSERFKKPDARAANSVDVEGVASLEPLKCRRRQLACSRTLLGSSKLMEYEKEIKRLLMDRADLQKSFDQKSAELKKMDSKLQTLIRERTHLQGNIASVEKQIKELRRVNEIIKTKLSALEGTTCKKSLATEVARLKAELLSKDHEMQDIREELTAAKMEHERCLLQLTSNSDDITQMKAEMQEQIDCLQQHLTQSDKIIEDIRSEKQILEDRNNSAIGQIHELEEEVMKCEGTVIELQKLRDDLMEEISACNNQLKLKQEGWAKSVANLQEENVKLLSRLEEHTTKKSAEEKAMTIELDNAYQKLMANEENYRDLLESRDALANRVTVFKSTIAEMEKQQSLDLQSLKDLKRQLLLLTSESADKDNTIATLTENVSSYKQQLMKIKEEKESYERHLLQMQSDLETLQSNKQAEVEKLQAELDVNLMVRKLTEEELGTLRTVVAEMEQDLKWEKEAAKTLTAELQEEKNSGLLSRMDLTNQIDVANAAITQKSEELSVADKKLSDLCSELDSLNAKLDFQIAEKEKVETMASERNLRIAALEDEISVVKSQSSDQEAKIGILNVQKEELAVRIVAVEGERDDLKHSLEQKTLTMAEMESAKQKSKVDFERQLEDLQNQLNAQDGMYKKALSEREEKLNGVSQRLFKIEQEKSHLEFQLSEINNIKGILEEELRRSELAIEELEVARNHQEDKISDLVSQVESSQAKLGESDTANYQLKENLDVKAEEVEALSKQVDEMMKAKHEDNSALATLRKLHDEANNEIVTLKVIIENNNKVMSDSNITSALKDLEEKTVQLEAMWKTTRMQQYTIKNLESRIAQMESERNLLLANSEWLADREKDLQKELAEVEDRKNQELKNSMSVLRDTQKHLADVENELQSAKHLSENNGRQNEETLQALIQEYESKLQIQAHAVQSMEQDALRWQTLYKDLKSKVEPFQDQLDAYEIERSVLMSKNTEAMSDLHRLSQQYAQLLGHQNHKQKIQHLNKLKDENLSLKEENTKLWTEVLKHRKASQRKLPSSVRKFDPSKAFQIANKENIDRVHQGE